MRKLALASCALVLAALAAREASAFGSGDKGTSGAQFLKITPGARPSAMGDAFAGVADDVHAIYYNPAGLGTLRRVEVAGMHDSFVQGVNYEFAAMAVPLLSWVDTKEEKNKYGVLGVAVYDLQVGGIERRSTTETDQAVDTFGSSDFAYALSYGYRVPDIGLSLGATAKFVNQTLDTAKANAFAADVGALYRFDRVGLGAGIRNVGSRVKFGTASDPLPTTAFGGLGYKFSDRWIGSVEVDVPRDNSASVGFGTEYRHPFADKLTGAVRAGYSSRNTDAGGFSGATFGLGLGYGNFDFDFAFVPFGELGNAVKYSLVVKF